MNTLSVAVLACLVALCAAKPSWGGHWDDGLWGHHANVVHGNGATLIGPGPGHAVISGPVAHGLGWGHGWGWDGLHGHGHGVVVKGPHTVPAAIVGPSGKIVADGLYGVGHGHHHW